MQANPELIRNLRAQLRPDRMAASAAICLALSLVAGFSESYHHPESSARWGRELLGLVVWAQAVVLVLGGGLAALQAVARERELNTFDFQRVTRLTPAELAVGKLLGAPALMYFIVLCLMPAAAVGAMAAGARLSFVLAAYMILILGAVTVHAFALLLSLFVERGAATAGALLILAALWFPGAQWVHVALRLGDLSPFVAGQVVAETSWAVDPAAAQHAVFFPRRSPLTDVLFGWPVHHVAVLVVLYLVFTAWFLLAVVRNIKRDPAVYQIFTPLQALGLVLWINLIVLAFFRWSQFAPLNAHNAFLGLNVALFLALGLALLRNRDTMRRLRARRDRAGSWIASVWPAPYVTASLAVGLVPVAVLEWLRQPEAEWDLGLAVFRVAIIAAWMMRDLLFLQWMNLQRGSRPLRRGILYLAVFYTCVGVVLTTLHSWTFEDPVGLAIAAVFLPPMALGLRPAWWASGWTLWLAGLGIQIAVAALFASLQHVRLAEFEPAAETKAS
jgi:hypothetical protein